MTVPCWWLTPGAASLRSLAVQVPGPATRSLTVSASEDNVVTCGIKHLLNSLSQCVLSAVCCGPVVCVVFVIHVNNV